MITYKHLENKLCIVFEDIKSIELIDKEIFTEYAAIYTLLFNNNINITKKIEKLVDNYVLYKISSVILICNNFKDANYFIDKTNDIFNKLFQNISVKPS